MKEDEMVAALVAERTQSLERELAESKRAERQMQLSLDYFEALINRIPDAMVVKDDRHRFVLVNDAECSLAGQSRAMLLGKTDGDFFPKEQVDVFWEMDDRVLETGEASLNEETLKHGLTGELLTVMTHKTRYVDQSGNRFVVALIRDITERKRLETELNHERDLFQTLMDSLPDHIFFKDIQRRIIKTNRAHATALGFQHPEEAIGLTDFDLFPPEQARTYAAEENAVLRSGQPLICRAIQTPNSEGDLRWLLESKVPIRDQAGQVRGLVGISHDITELKRTEAALERERGFLRRVINAVPDFVCVKDHEGRFLIVNQALAGSYRTAIASVEGRLEAEFNPNASQVSQSQRDDREVMATRQPKFIPEESMTFADGQRHWLSINKVPLVDEAGACSQVLVVTTDITERKRTEQQLQVLLGEQAASLSLLNATLESATDGILAVSLAHQVVCYNQKFVTLWGLPAAIMETRNGAEVAAYIATKVSDAEVFLDRFRRLREEHELETFALVPLKDGRVFERFLRPQRVGNQCVGAVISYRDITERRQAQAQLEAASRQAGMAEVATNVLHNVGNVLNSVNISMSVIEGHARASQAPDVVKVADLLEEHRGDLAEFLTRDNRAAKVIGYLRTLAQHLASRQSALLAEVMDLTKNVDHIKDIVAMQQGDARMAGIAEPVMVVDLVNDALAIHTRALLQHDVQVVREYDPRVPGVTVEKHKLLQILVNLIGNAKHACDESERADKRLTLRVTSEPERVFISVSDNGIGISADNLTRIFQHGFTTRLHGHGFGLHSAALAAREMKGALRAQSDGPGLGATFILELPRPPVVQTA